MADSAKKLLRMSAREFVTCLAVMAIIGKAERKSAEEAPTGLPQCG
jgi:hypothetical protein